MQFNQLKLLTDENISPKVVSFFRANGFDVYDVKESGLQGTTDLNLLSLANKQLRFVVTHDSDFGTLAINNNHPCYGIIYLRLKLPTAENVILTLTVLYRMNPDFQPGSLVVLDEHRMRVRQL
jgi:predicted nuclease of predicted toxin-antitoxin system